MNKDVMNLGIKILPCTNFISFPPYSEKYGCCSFIFNFFQETTLFSTVSVSICIPTRVPFSSHLQHLLSFIVFIFIITIVTVVR